MPTHHSPPRNGAQNNPPPADKMVSAAAAARILGVSTDRVRQLRQAGKLRPAQQVETTGDMVYTLYREADVLELDRIRRAALKRPLRVHAHRRPSRARAA